MPSDKIDPGRVSLPSVATVHPKWPPAREYKAQGMLRDSRPGGQGCFVAIRLEWIDHSTTSAAPFQEWQPGGKFRWRFSSVNKGYQPLGSLHIFLILLKRTLEFLLFDRDTIEHADEKARGNGTQTHPIAGHETNPDDDY